MAKVTLGNRPKSFKEVTVTCAMPEGGNGEIGVIYKYRTRQQYADYTDEIFRLANMKPVTVPDAVADLASGDGVVNSEAAKKVEEFQFSLAEAMKKTIKNNADFIIGAIDGWDLDVALNRAAIEQLCDELPGAAFGIVEKYRAMCTEGRLGN